MTHGHLSSNPSVSQLWKQKDDLWVARQRWYLPPKRAEVVFHRFLTNSRDQKVVRKPRDRLHVISIVETFDGVGLCDNIAGASHRSTGDIVKMEPRIAHLVYANSLPFIILIRTTRRAIANSKWSTPPGCRTSSSPTPTGGRE